MDLKHFSHNHALTFHKVPQGSQIECSACKSAGSGDVYACFQCNHFLHQHCFRAARSLKHPSHPLHSLTLVPSPTYPSGSFICNSCNLGGDGLSYSCSECDFDIHVHCALITPPNPIPPAAPRSIDSSVRHKFHPHPLTLLPAPAPIYGDEYACDACLKVGRAFVYNCATCSYDLHPDCFRLPETVTRPDHEHPLSLSAPTESFMCDVCKTSVNEKAWLYRCGDCDYGTHLECVRSEEQDNTGDITAQLLELRQQEMHNMLQFQRTRVNNQFIAQKIQNSLIGTYRYKQRDDDDFFMSNAKPPIV